MFLRKSFDRMVQMYHDYPKQFWVLILGVFIDNMGRTLLFPFMTLYLTRRFGVGMTEIGLLFMLLAGADTMGSIIGGALTDRLGRKKMMLLGLFVSGMSSLILGFVDSFGAFFGIMLFVGIVGSIGGPAHQAMVADLLPEDKRGEGFGILRVVVNICYILGPTIGGLVAARSYLLLFIGDAVFSSITALIVLLVIRETRPVALPGKAEESLGQTFVGYGRVLRDTTFVMFIGACILMTLVYQQLYTTLAVFLRDVHGISEQGFGALMSANATLVVLTQFPVTRYIARFRPMILMAVGTLFYAVGFAMYGFTSTYPFFLAAMLIITVGEMIVMPTANALVARLAPADMRGRYMAIFGFSWVIPTAFGPLLAGLIMDNLNPNWVWYSGGIISMIAVFSFLLLHRRVHRSGEIVQEGTPGEPAPLQTITVPTEG